MTIKTRAPRQTKTARLRKRMDGALKALAQVELIKPSQDTASEPVYMFKHALVQDTAQSTLLHGEYKRLNRLVANAYETVYAERCMDEYAPHLAKYYGEAGDDEKTIAYATRAADLAMQVYALPEAIAFYSQALKASLERGSGTQLIYLFTKRGRALELNLQETEAVTNYQEMEALGQARGERSLELAGIISRTTLLVTLTRAFDPTQARQLSERALGLARELDDRAAQAKIFWNLMLADHQTREFARSIAFGKQSLELARELGLREQLAFTLNDLGRAYMAAGQMAHAFEAFQEARGLWRELDNQPMLTDNLMMSGTFAMLQGNFEESAAFSDEGIQISRRIGNLIGEFSSLGTRMAIHFEYGEFAPGLEIIERALLVIEKIHLFPSLALMRSIRGWVFATLGAFEDAREMARLTQLALEQPMPPFFRTWALTYLVRLYVMTNDLSPAAEAIKQGQAVPGARGVEPAGLSGPISEAEYALAKGEFGRVVKELNAHIAQLREFHIRMSLDEALFLLAQASRAQGESAHAFEFLEQARLEAEALTVRRTLWQIYAVMSEMEKERGNTEQANALRTQAREVIEFIVEHTPAELRASFLNLPRVREVMA